MISNNSKSISGDQDSESQYDDNAQSNLQDLFDYYDYITDDSSQDRCFFLFSSFYLEGA